MVNLVSVAMDELPHTPLYRNARALLQAWGKHGGQASRFLRRVLVWGYFSGKGNSQVGKLSTWRVISLSSPPFQLLIGRVIVSQGCPGSTARPKPSMLC